MTCRFGELKTLRLKLKTSILSNFKTQNPKLKTQNLKPKTQTAEPTLGT
jgi:hypothetical protein